MPKILNVFCFLFIYQKRSQPSGPRSRTLLHFTSEEETKRSYSKLDRDESRIRNRTELRRGSAKSIDRTSQPSKIRREPDKEKQPTVSYRSRTSGEKNP